LTERRGAGARIAEALPLFAFALAVTALLLVDRARRPDDPHVIRTGTHLVR
jgi:hypothetical protein